VGDERTINPFGNFHFFLRQHHFTSMLAHARMTAAASE
jgi:hypothetical protein